MKTQIFTYLLLFLVPVQTLAATDCKIVEFPDRTEVICIGDEIARPEPTVPEKPLRAISAENATQNQVVAPQMPESVPAAAMAQAPLTFSTAQTHAPVNAANVTQNQVVVPQIPEPVPVAAMAQSPLPFGTATTQTGAPVNPANKAAEDLAKRRELATRITLNLKSYTSATTLPAK